MQPKHTLDWILQIYWKLHKYLLIYWNWNLKLTENPEAQEQNFNYCIYWKFRNPNILKYKPFILIMISSQNMLALNILTLYIFICVNLYIINLTFDQIHIIDKKIIQFACVTKNWNVNLNRKKKISNKSRQKNHGDKFPSLKLLYSLETASNINKT